MLQIPKINVVYNHPKISFKGSPEKLVSSIDLSSIEVKILPGTNKQCADTILKCIDDFPSYWLNKFKQRNYEVVIANSLDDAFKFERIYDSNIKYYQNIDPTKRFSATYSNYSTGKNFFAFEPDYSNKYIEGNVNHELCHGIINIKGLHLNNRAKICIYDDLAISEYLRNLSSDELNIIKIFFKNERAPIPVKEIMADTLACLMGRGKYGAGSIFDEDNKGFMCKVFLNLSHYLQKNVEHIKD